MSITKNMQGTEFFTHIGIVCDSEHVFKNDFYQSDGIMSSQDSTNMMDVTEDIFSGGRVYAYDYPIQGVQIYRLFNPCNQFEIFLVQ